MITWSQHAGQEVGPCLINTVFSFDRNAGFREQECQVLGTGKASEEAAGGL